MGPVSQHFSLRWHSEMKPGSLLLGGWLLDLLKTASPEVNQHQEAANSRVMSDPACPWAAGNTI